MAVPEAARGITAVVVTYNPDPEQLAQLCQAVQPQVEHIVLVDNGSSAETLAALQALVEGPSSAQALLALGENRGIGAAQNAGIAVARQHGSRYVLLLDHDSIPEAGMVATLRAAIESQSAGSPPVAAAGPRYADARQTTNPYPFVQLEEFKRGLISMRTVPPGAKIGTRGGKIKRREIKETSIEATLGCPS